jgi:hypothetical protein
LANDSVLPGANIKWAKFSIVFKFILKEKLLENVADCLRARIDLGSEEKTKNFFSKKK